jgi:hypothetical protein
MLRILSEIVAAASRPDDYLFRRQSHRRRRAKIICLCCRANLVCGYQHRQRGRYDGRGAGAISDAVWIKIPRLVIVLLGGKIFCARCVPGEIVQRTQAQSAMMTIAGVKLGLFTSTARFLKRWRGSWRTLRGAGAEGILTDSVLRSDRSNPNDAGYRMIAERIAAKIKPLLREADGLRGPSGLG